MKIKIVYIIPIDESMSLGIPKEVTHKQLNDSGYTYRFEHYKESIRRSLIDKIVGQIKFDIVNGRMGYEITGEIDSDDLFEKKEL